MTRRIGIVTTSRADLSPLRPVMAAVAAHPELTLEVYATGMHLADGFGASLQDLRDSGFAPSVQLPSIFGTGEAAAAAAIGAGTSAFAAFFADNRPDILVVLGDRYDMMPAVLAALPFRLPVAHLHGGELTLGAMDDCIRHAVSKMAHLHFVATADFGRRLRQLGEEDWRIDVVGAPGLDNLAAAPQLDRRQLEALLGVPADGAFSLATLHPETLADLDAHEQGERFATAAERIDGTIVLTAPNADPGHQQIRYVLQDLAARRPNTIWLENAGPQGYPNLLRQAACVVGNSSSGIIEAGYFGRPVVDIGRRQHGRPSGDNVVHVDWSIHAIHAAWVEALGADARRCAARASHPYGKGGAAVRIAARLAEIALDERLTYKLFMDHAG